MRGKVKQELESLRSSRITPAYAGKRLFGVTLFAYNKDHPRLCGEK